MAANYLEQFRKIIDKRQADQLLRLVNKKKQTGEIRTVDEFIGKLDSLVRTLTESTLKPSLQPFEALENDVISSETFNYMLDRIQDDLEAGFEEAVNIEEVQNSHRAIARDVMLRRVELAVSELESKLDLYELISGNIDGFNSYIFSTFREAGENRTLRSLARSSVLFKDPRSGVDFIPAEDATIEGLGERLTLAYNFETFAAIKTANQIFDSGTPQSELVVEMPNVRLANILDNTRKTYWAQTLLYSNIRPFVNIKIELILQGVQDVNFIEVEPIPSKGFFLSSVAYEDLNGLIHTVASPNVELTKTTRVLIPKISTSRIILTFKHENPLPIEFEYDAAETSLFEQLHTTEPGGPVASIKNLSADLGDILSSVKLKDIVDLLPRNVSEFSGYEFTFGIDNVRAGLVSYKDKSIYISPPLRVSNPGLVGLRTQESRPSANSLTAEPSYTSITYDLDDSVFLHSSLEHWVVKRDFDDLGNVLQTTHFPILPIGQVRVNHERLLLVTKSNIGLSRNDTGRTLFFTDRTSGAVKVYRNGQLLTYNLDWFDDTSLEDKTPDSGQAMRFLIRIASPLEGDIFTVSYAPSVSVTRSVPASVSVFAGGGIDIVDMKGDLGVRMFDSNLIGLDPTQDAIKADHTELFFISILRNNSARFGITPALEEYQLLVASENE